MADRTTLEQVEALAALLSPEEQTLLSEWLAERVSAEEPRCPEPRTDWMSLRGVAADLLGNEDAQRWTSHSRQQSDEQRKKALKPCP